MTRTRLIPVLFTALLLAGCGAATDSDTGTAANSAGVSAPASSPSAAAESSTPAGAYLTLAAYEKDPQARAGTEVVLFFHAPWCPDCRATEASLKADGVPDGLTVVKVDYDNRLDLRRKYGITQQHSFVTVDERGAKQKLWTGSRTGAEIAQAA